MGDGAAHLFPVLQAAGLPLLSFPRNCRKNNSSPVLIQTMSRFLAR